MVSLAIRASARSCKLAWWEGSVRSNVFLAPDISFSMVVMAFSSASALISGMPACWFPREVYFLHPGVGSVEKIGVVRFCINTTPVSSGLSRHRIVLSDGMMRVRIIRKETGGMSSGRFGEHVLI